MNLNLFIRIAALAAAVAASAASAGSSAKIQCWTDEKGQRACGNSVPVQYADKERETFNARGRVVETKPHAETIEDTDAAAKAKPDEGKGPAPAAH